MVGVAARLFEGIELLRLGVATNPLAGLGWPVQRIAALPPLPR